MPLTITTSWHLEAQLKIFLTFMSDWISLSILTSCRKPSEKLWSNTRIFRQSYTIINSTFWKKTTRLSSSTMSVLTDVPFIWKRKTTDIYGRSVMTMTRSHSSGVMHWRMAEAQSVSFLPSSMHILKIMRIPSSILFFPIRDSNRLQTLRRNHYRIKSSQRAMT